MVTEDKIRELLKPEAMNLPRKPAVSRIDVQTYEESESPGVDSGVSGEALWINVILAEDTLDKDRSWEAVRPIDQAIRECLRREGVDLFPYIEFVKQSELAA